MIAATNFENQSLDYAIWRRFDETIRFDMPTNEEKIAMFTTKYENDLRGRNHVFEHIYERMHAFSHSDVENGLFYL